MCIGHELKANAKITASQVRLIDQDGAQLGIMDTDEAIRLAEQKGADLVEVAPESEPPVCRLMDYGKFKYKQKKKTQQGHKKAHVTQIKELRIRPKIGAHDMAVKMNKAREFLGAGDRLVVNMMFRGRELSHRELGEEVLKGMIEALADAAKVEGHPNFQGRKMSIMLVPRPTPSHKE